MTMTDKHTDALKAFKRLCSGGRAYGFGLASGGGDKPYSRTEDIELVTAALSPVDVEKIKQEMLEMLVMACDMHRPSEDYKQGWIDAINHLSQRKVLR